jgi:hypothetical protein
MCYGIVVINVIDWLVGDQGFVFFVRERQTTGIGSRGLQRVEE